MDWSIVIQLVSIVAVSVGLYIAIRTDLAAMHEKITAANARIDVIANDANKAHDRIDNWYREGTRT